MKVANEAKANSVEINNENVARKIRSSLCVYVEPSRVRVRERSSTHRSGVHRVTSTR